jgi:PAS domain S-box-containing protein
MRQIISKGLASIYTDVPTLRPGTLEAYALAFASAGVATVVRLAIDPYVLGAECLPFFPAVMITALIGGRGAGLFCVVLSAAAVTFLQMPPLTLLLFVLLAIFIVILITRMRFAIQQEQAAQAMQASKDRLQFTLDAARLGSWRYDARHGVFSWDARSKDIFGVPEDKATVEEFMNWVHPDDVEGVWAAYHRTLDPAQPEQSPTQFRLRRGDGKVRWLETQGLTYLGGAGREQQVVDFIGTVQDITAHKEAEEAQARLAAIVTSSADAIVGKTLDGTVTSWNKAAEHMFGYSASEMIGQSIRRLVPTDRQAEEDTILSRMARSESVERHEMMLVAKDERTFNTSITISPIRDAEGRNIGCSKIIRDITERKQMEAQLAAREAQLALFVEHAPVAIAMFDDKMRYLAVSRRLLSDYELGDPSEVIGRSHYEVFPDIPARWREFHVRVLAGEELAEEEDFFPRRDGRVSWVRWSMKPWRTVSGRIGGAILFVELITEQVEARRALAESEARFRATFENAAVGIAHVDPYLGWLRVNEAFCQILGYSVEELLAKSVRDITHPDDFAVDIVNSALMRSGELNSAEMDKRYVRKDGSIVTCRLTVSCVRKSDRSIDYFVGIIQDITWRKQAEEELRKSEERFRSSVLHSPMPTMLFDNREEILAVSQSWLDESGYSSAELCRLKDWTDRAYGQCSAEVLKILRQIIATEPPAQPSERMIRTKDGRERLWSFVKSPLGAQSGGRRVFITVAQDLTEWKAREEQVRLLLREVNHRAKNLLSVVQAIVRQTAASSHEDFIERLTRRIQALAANHDLLVRNEWRGVDVDHLVHAQLSPFADLIGSRIVIDGPKLRLNSTAAQPIGLVLHELATNAGKYGALSTEAGQVKIRWEVAEDDTFVLSWTERDGPPVSTPTRRGFGTVVMEMTGYSIGGAVDLDYAPSGLTWRLTSPVMRSLERRERKQTSGDQEG